MEEAPKLARRRENRKSTIRSGRTIGEARERLETANERAAARKKDKRKSTLHIIIVSGAFLALIVVLVLLARSFLHHSDDTPSSAAETLDITSLTPTVEIIDENATGDPLTTKMREYIALAEADFKDLGLTPTRVVLPSGTIREVDFYLEGYSGHIKLVTDRGSAVSAEDAERMLRYLAGQGITDFEYIDVRTDGKAFWK